MAAAREDISQALAFDYLVVNDRFEVALADLQAILRANRLRRPAQLRQRGGVIRRALGGERSICRK